MKTSERCIVVEDGKRCARSSKETGGAKGLCPMHYQRSKRTGSTESTNPADLGPSAKVVFLLPEPQHTRLVRRAEKEGTTVARVLRTAVEHFLAAKN